MTSWSILFEKMSKYDVAEVKLARTWDKLQLLLAFTRWKVAVGQLSLLF